MLVLHDSNGLVTGLQLFPETSDAPHIVVSDSLFDLLKIVVGKISLVQSGDNLFLPNNVEQLANETVLVEKKQQKLAELDTCFSEAMALGVEFDFSGNADVIQTRDERDLINISGITTRAMLLQSQGVTNPVINFRAQSNTTYQLTPTEAMQLGDAVALKIEELYGILWALKDAIENAATVQAIETITWPQA